MERQNNSGLSQDPWGIHWLMKQWGWCGVLGQTVGRVPDKQKESPEGCLILPFGSVFEEVLAAVLYRKLRRSQNRKTLGHRLSSCFMPSRLFGRKAVCLSSRIFSGQNHAGAWSATSRNGRTRIFIYSSRKVCCLC